MMKGIKISTKISVLVILVSLVAVGAISFFTYDFNVKTNREKITNNLSVITENRAAQINTYFDKISYAISILQKSQEIKGDSSTASAPPADDFAVLFDMGGGEATDSTSEESTSTPLEDFLNTQKDAFGFEHIYITSSTGAIAASTDSKFKSGNFPDPDGTSFGSGLKGIHFSAVFKDNANYFVYVLAPLDGGQLLISKLKLNDLYKSLQDYRGLGNQERLF